MMCQLTATAAERKVPSTMLDLTLPSFVQVGSFAGLHVNMVFVHDTHNDFIFLCLHKQVFWKPVSCKNYCYP